MLQRSIHGFWKLYKIIHSVLSKYIIVTIPDTVSFICWVYEEKGTKKVCEVT